MSKYDNSTLQAEKQTWTPHPENWYAWNINLLQIELSKRSTINYVCRDSNENL